MLWSFAQALISHTHAFLVWAAICIKTEKPGLRQSYLMNWSNSFKVGVVRGNWVAVFFSALCKNKINTVLSRKTLNNVLAEVSSSDGPGSVEGETVIHRIISPWSPFGLLIEPDNTLLICFPDCDLKPYIHLKKKNFSTVLSLEKNCCKFPRGIWHCDGDQDKALYASRKSTVRTQHVGTHVKEQLSAF